MPLCNKLNVFILLNTAFMAVSFEIFKEKDKCALDENFWVVFGRFLELSDTVSLTNLYYYRGNYETIDELAVKIIKWLNASIIVNNHFLRNSKYESVRCHMDSSIEEWPLRHMEPIDNKRIKKIRYLASDPKNASIVIGDMRSVEIYLRNKSVVQNHREIFIIFLIDSTIEDICVGSVLERFWKQMKILNVIVHNPCSSEEEYIYIYKPFSLREDVFGITEKYNTNDILLNQHLMVHSLENLNGYKLNVTMFIRIPTSFRKEVKSITTEEMETSGGYYGLDGSLLSALATKMNFKVLAPEIRDKGDFGRVTRKGRITGSLAEVVCGRAEFAGNSRFVVDYGTNEIEFTKTIYSDQICAIVPKALRIPQGVAIFKSFNLWSWLAILAVFAISMISRYCFHCITSSSFIITDSNIFFEVYGVLLGVTVKLKHSRNYYFFFSCCMIFNVIVIGIFEGNLMKSSSIISYYKDINSLSELDNTNLPVVTSLSVLDNDDSNLIRKLYLKKQNIGDHKTLNYLCKYRNISTLGRKKDTIFYEKYYYTGKNGESLLHIVEECLLTYFGGYIVPKGSVYLNKIDDVLVNLVEGGFIGKWYSDAVDFVLMQEIFKIEYFDPQQPFNLNDVQAAFFFLVIGLFLACIAFIYEVFFECNVA